MIGDLKKLFWHAYAKCYKTCELHKPIIDLNRDVRQTVLVFGSARSGTTCVSSVISKMLKARQVFEPFLLDKNRQFYLTSNRRINEDDLDQNLQLYIRPHPLENHYAGQIEQILQGDVQSPWSGKGCKAGFYSRRVIKEVRANLFMAYIASKWPDMKIIWIIRNPANVIESQMAMRKIKWRFDWDIDNIKAQPELLADWLSPFLPDMVSAKSLCERLAHKWCIETYIPLKQNIEGLPNVLRVQYETLFGRPEEWEKINAFLSCKKWDRDQLRKLLSIPSFTSRQFHQNTLNKESSSAISTEDFAKINRIVSIYGLSSFMPSHFQAPII